MARMIPNYCITNSPGEKKIFSLMRDSVNTEDWVILHSLHIARHESKVKGEADFVILIPNRGVIILEVKSHLKVQMRDGSWFLGAAQVPSESPFVQSETAMFSIRKKLNAVLPFTRAITFLNLCWFTEVEFPKDDSFEWLSWQVLNASDKANPAESILSAYDSGVKHLQDKISASIPIESSFNLDNISRVLEVLRPDFEFGLSKKEVRESRQIELVSYAREQFTCLDLFSENERVVYTGAAGTGKTVLAIEIAMRLAVQGRKTVLLCFNRFLMSELKRSLEGISVEVRTIDSIILEIAKKRYSNLPRNPIEALRAISYSDLKTLPNERFDCLIIDEAQDVFQEKYLPFLNELIVGGLSRGNWHAFGDFESQRMFSQENGQKALEMFSKNHAVGSLTLNCRNVMQIGHFVQGVLPRVPKWSGFRRSEDLYPEPELISVPTGADVVPFMDEAIDLLLNASYSFEEICVLTPIFISDPNDVFSHSKYATVFADHESDTTGKIKFSSIGKFKGLESTCVIALDIETMITWNNRSEMLYVLFTRPTDRLTILSSEVGRRMLIESSLGDFIS